MGPRPVGTFPPAKPLTQLQRCEGRDATKAAPDRDRPRMDAGADEGTRTPSLRFTRPLLCLLSYVGPVTNLPQESHSVKGIFPKKSGFQFPIA